MFLRKEALLEQVFYSALPFIKKHVKELYNSYIECLKHI